MARVIKGNKANADSAKVIIATTTAQSGGRIIERDIYDAQQRAKEIVKQGEIERKKRLADGKKAAVQAKEDAMLASATEVFANAAKEALAIFKAKGDQCAPAARDIQRISDEIIRKILGDAPTLPADQIAAMIQDGVQKMRSRRRARLMFAMGALKDLNTEQQGLLAQVKLMPEFDILESDEVSSGVVRVVTDVGNALCDQSVALKTLGELFSSGADAHGA